MSRPVSVLRLVAYFLFALAFTFAPRAARAQASKATQGAAPAKATDTIPHPGPSVRGFDLLASAGWGVSTAKVLNVELAPYGASFGVDLGYTWSLGFRFGGYFSKSLGRTVFQHRDPLIGRQFDFNAQSESVNGGLSLGWDVPLASLRLRYTLAFGVTSMRWEFEDVPPTAVRFDVSNPNVGVHFAPGIALLWPYRGFEGGLGFDYLVQAKGTIPSGFVAKLLIGVRP